MYGFIGNEVINFWDSLGLEPQEAEAEGEAKLNCCCFEGDTPEPKPCHIWVYLQKVKRNRFGSLFLYDHCGKLVFTTYVRVEGKSQNRDPLKPNGNTPTGYYDAKIDTPQGGGDDGPYGSNDNIRITGRGDYENQPARAGQACDAKRAGLLIHAGRAKQGAKAKITVEVWDIAKGKWVKKKVDKVWNTAGCLRTQKDEHDKMIKKIKSLKCCSSWMVHVREGKPNPKFITKKPPFVLPVRKK